MKTITSLQHPLVKHFVRLRDSSRYRYEKGSCVVEGVKIVTELCKTMTPKVVMAVEGLADGDAIMVSEAVMKKVSGCDAPEGVLAEVALPDTSPQILKGKEKIIVLDGVADPGNVGTLVRTALALGWQGVFIIESGCDPFNEKALRAAKGATFRLPVAKGSWKEADQIIKEGNLQALLADMQGLSPEGVDRREKIALVLGNESWGVSEQARERCKAVAIPMPGEMESLNVAVAGGILMYLLGR